MNITTIGIDLTKNTFSLHWADAHDSDIAHSR